MEAAVEDHGIGQVCSQEQPPSQRQLWLAAGAVLLKVEGNVLEELCS